MEKIRDIWRQQSIETVFAETMDVSPIGRDVDLVFTTSRLVAVATEKRKQSPSWVYGAAAGPLGLLATGTVAALWSAYQNATKDKRLDSEMLDLLIKNGLALGAYVEGLICEVNQYKKSLFDYISIVPDTDSRIALYGKFAFQESLLQGAIWQIQNYSAKKAKRKIENLLPIRVDLGSPIELEGPNSVEIRVTGRDLTELRRQRYQSQNRRSSNE